MNRFDSYIEQILERIECGEEERGDMREEIRSHLEAAREAYMEQGYSEEEAIRRSVADFGVADEIGEGLQHSLFPYRKELLTFIGMGTILYSVSGYLHSLFTYGEAHVIWVTLSMIFGTCLVLASIYPAYLANRKVMLGAILIGTTFCAAFGFLLLETSEDWYAKPLYALGTLIATVSLVMVFMTALKGIGSKSESPRERTARTVIHVFNLAIGFVVLGLAAIMTYGGLIFGGVSPFLLVPIGMVAFWGFSYWMQYRMRKSRTAVSYLFGGFSFIFIGCVIYMIVGRM
ncbi:permease prefix domain 1-containing protein [Aneurinibacillus danicus]|uniref:Uncharacterized protein n=1 Tax=Aneurinibacillus danicus TaxID=267746 RepID=A0A511VCA7_9BACL|nr:permease prefix domain 1-containing protein [Aneurinibacillus danicus]GEN35991.1 hypothetical protein ADA01nite_34510 [Aneurinibacillus danicus]